MLYLNVIQAKYGDAFIVEYGAPSSPRYLLVDGGPGDVYGEHIRSELEKISAAGGALELAVLSHVDADHITGLLDLFSDLRAALGNGIPPVIAVNGLWENGFDRTIGSTNNNAVRLMNILGRAGERGFLMSRTSLFAGSISEGNQLRIAARALGIPIDAGFNEGPITVDTASEPITMDNMTFRIVGPTQKNLARLQKDWEDWLKAQERAAPAAVMEALAADTSVPNLSSLMFLLEAPRTRRILMTGDGTGGDLLDGLEQAGLLVDGKIHVSVLKVPHHGSARNVTPDFLSCVSADTYVISANGRDGNPDLDTLLWIVDAAHARGKHFRIVVTNKTPSTIELLQARPRSIYDYTLSVFDESRNSIRV